MKLCNDCDLNYRTSKNKRLLVELTLIQCAQLTLPDADDLIGGRSPRKRLKPLFTQQIVIPSPAQPQGGETAVKSNPLPELKTEKRKIPVMKWGTGISIRNHQPQEEKKQVAAPTNRVTPTYQEDYEDHIFTEDNIKYYWREFSQQQLPIEEKANAARMMNMHPKLLNDTTFEVGVDNGMVEKYMNRLAPAIQNYLREKLHNRKITMKVRVFEAKEVVRAYSPVERFQLMTKKNPKLMKLKEVFGLELA